MIVGRQWFGRFLAVVAVGVLVSSAMASSKGSWMIATDVQKYYRCLPFDWYFVRTDVRGYSPTRGDMVKFRAPGSVARFNGQFEVIKIVAATPGDHWRIADDRLFINGRLWGALYLRESLGIPLGGIDGEGVVPPGHVYVLGTNPSSYDSRYWGSLPTNLITGRAYALI